jgi:phosphonate transport system ATP-binding protein
MSAPAFCAINAGVQFNGTAALHAVDLQIEPGEAVAFVGPSGAGKTTLLRLLNGVLRPSAGSVFFGGQPWSSLPARELRAHRARIGFIHQDLSLVPELRVVQNVVTGRIGRTGLLASLRAMLLPSKQSLRDVHALLERVGIPEKLYERTSNLSGGQRQRVAIARALYQEPQALLADEPVSSVDPARARDTVRLLTEICQEEGLTLCVSLHNLELAREFFPRLVGLRHGRVEFDRSTTKVEEREFKALYDLSPEEILNE